MMSAGTGACNKTDTHVALCTAHMYEKECASTYMSAHTLGQCSLKTHAGKKHVHTKTNNTGRVDVIAVGCG